MNTAFPFDRQKATESAAEFIRLAGGSVNILKLVKLMYLLDRQALEQVGVPVVGGSYVSMKDGPVTSEVLDSINHKNGEGNAPWDDFITERNDYHVSIRKNSTLDHLSPFEMDLIRELHEEHKTKDRYKLRDWCHENCHEWVAPKLLQRGSIPIPVETLAAEIRRTRAELEEAVKEAAFMADVFDLA